MHTEATQVSRTLVQRDSGAYGLDQLPSQLWPCSIPTCGNSSKGELACIPVY